MTTTSSLILRICLLSCVTYRQVDGFFLHNGCPIRVGSFNIKHFGVTKMSDPEVPQKIVDIFSRYDVILVQEVRDSRHKALNDLLTLLRKTDPAWSYTSSKPLGRSIHYKEQYVFFYRTPAVSIEATHQTPDPKDFYERDPFAIKVKYQSLSTSQSRHVSLLGIHVKPHGAEAELKALPGTIRDVASLWPSADGVITMGDFNADCRYLNDNQRASMELFNASLGFHSLIPDDADTTVGKSRCAYDRIVVYGNHAKVNVRHAQVYDFKADLNLNQTEAEDVSDHFPVEFNLY